MCEEEINSLISNYKDKINKNLSLEEFYNHYTKEELRNIICTILKKLEYESNSFFNDLFKLDIYSKKTNKQVLISFLTSHYYTIYEQLL